MTKKTKAPAPLPSVNIFCSVSHETWRKLTVLAAEMGMRRLELYSLALTVAADDHNFFIYLVDYRDKKAKKAKK